MDKKGLAHIIAKALFYASLQGSFGSVEMSSKFSVMNFSKDQETLQRAADALRSYIYIAVVWTVATMLALYASYGMIGLWCGLIANLIMIAWIVISYIYAFKQAAERYKLQQPFIMTKNAWLFLSIIIAAFVIFSVCPSSITSLFGLSMN